MMSRDPKTPQAVEDAALETVQGGLLPAVRPAASKSTPVTVNPAVVTPGVIAKCDGSV
jgi:hypothetical protein